MTLLPVLLSLSGAACQSDVNAPGPPTGRDVSFANDIQPIFDAHCASCHAQGAFATVFGGIQMLLTDGDAFGALVNQASSQDASLTLVTPGDSDNSLLFQKVSSNAPPVGSTMPLIGERLSSTDLALIRDWIDQGALDN